MTALDHAARVLNLPRLQIADGQCTVMTWREQRCARLTYGTVDHRSPREAADGVVRGGRSGRTRRNDEGRLVRRPSLAYPRLGGLGFAIAGLTVPAPLVAAGARRRKPGISIATSRRYARYLSPKRAIRSCSSSWMAIRM